MWRKIVAPPLVFGVTNGPAAMATTKVTAPLTLGGRFDVDMDLVDADGGYISTLDRFRGPGEGPFSGET